MKRARVWGPHDYIVECDGKNYLLVELGPADWPIQKKEHPVGRTTYWPSIPAPSGMSVQMVGCDQFGGSDNPIPPGELYLLEDLCPDRVIGKKTVRQLLAERHERILRGLEF